MKALGIIAEYNPLHNGHAWQLQEARRQSSADVIAVVMSTSFTQRGEPAILSTRDRVRMAMEAGADAVFALPALWAVRDAEHFALGGVSILQAIGCDAISFGAERGDAQSLGAVAARMEDEAVQSALRREMQSGIPYPEALARAMEQALPGSGEILSAPNNTLGICYLQAMRRLGADMEPVVISRSSSYHDLQLRENVLPSAAAIRRALRENHAEQARAAMPEQAWRILCQAKTAWPEKLDQALLYRLSLMSPEEYAAMPGISEGIENRLRQAAARCETREALLNEIKTRRYPYARLSRLCTHALLGLTAEAESAPLPQPWLLGMRESARPLLKKAQEKGTRILSRSGELDTNALWVKTEMLADRLWRMAAGEAPESLLSHRLLLL